MPPDYSRQCWKRPYLYKLLLEFGATYVTDISWNAITVNQNYRAAPHRDKGNVGRSYLVGFGDYTGGDLQILEGDLSGTYNICCQPIITDFSKVLHSVTPFDGNRVSLVYYTLRNAPPVPPPSFVQDSKGEWLFKRGDQIIRSGLPHPLLKRGAPALAKEESTVLVEFR
jgi:hypothetical protein